MTIKGEDFVFTPIKDASPLFDVELLQTVNKGKSNERQEFQNEAYGIPLDSAIKMVVNHRIRKGAGDSVMELQDYIKQFREEIKQLKDLVYGKERKED